MSSNINYHLTLSTDSNSYEVDLVFADKPSKASVIIDGRFYSITGDSSLWLKSKISQLDKANFQDFSEFKATLLQGDESSEKIQKIGVEVLVKDLTPKEKLRRAVNHAAQIGRGLTKLREQGIRGRTVLPGYYLEVTAEHEVSNPLAREKEQLWKEDETTKLSFPEWNQKMTEEWKLSGTDKGFVDWVLSERWKNSGSTDTYDDWLLKRIQKDFKNTDPFAKFKKEDTAFRKEIGKKELPHLPFKEFNALFNSRMMEGTTLSFPNWEKYKKWESLGSPGDFADWAMDQDYQKEVQGGSKLSFIEWKEKQVEKLQDRWEGSGFKAAGVPFEQWRLLQDDSTLVKHQPFIRLNDEQRELFHLSFSNGAIQRNGISYNTAHDKTLHSGDGYAIFVVNPEGEFYAGSHIGSVFHHSSFLADGAVAAAGELKTNENGEVTYISSKSGHYRPTDEESRLMLTMFRNFGVDLSKVKFSCYVRAGETLEFENAEEYLVHVEQVHKDREKLRLEITGGILQQKGSPISDTEQIVLINEMGQPYSGPKIEDSFKLVEPKTSTTPPKRPVTQISKEDRTIQEMKKTRARIERLSEDIESLQVLIKKTSKKNRAKRPGRQIQLEQKEAAIKKLEKTYSDLQATLNDIRELGKEVVKGGGVLTTDSEGKITRVDTKIGKKQLSDEEIVFTLRHLKSKSVDISQVTIVTYDNNGNPTEHKDAQTQLDELVKKHK